MRKWEKGKRVEDRGQMTEDRCQKAEFIEIGSRKKELRQIT
jgi:hypothetical protein